MPRLLLFLSAAAVATTVFCIKTAKRSRKDVDQRFPPISDAEFMERCTPGTNLVIALKVRRIIAETLGVEYERIYPSSRLVEDLGAD